MAALALNKRHFIVAYSNPSKETLIT